MKFLLLLVSFLLLAFDVDAVGNERSNVIKLKSLRSQLPNDHRNYIPNYSKEYVIDVIFVGESQKVFVVSLESGASDFWLLNSSYPHGSNVDTFNTSDPKSTAVDSGRVFQSTSADYGIYGNIFYDSVNYYGVWNQSFGVVNKIEGQWYDPKFNGIISGAIGLSWNPKLKNEPLTADSAFILNTFAASPELPRYFSMACSETSDDNSEEASGEITFGRMSDLCERNQIASTSLYFDDTYNSLSFKVDSFAMEKQKINGDVAKIDSGLPTMIVPEDAFNLIYDVIQPDYDYDRQLYTTECSNIGKFDDFVFTIGGVDLVVPSTIYIVDLGLGNNQCVVKLTEFTGDFTTPYTLGLPFQFAYCVKWDIENDKISMFNYAADKNSNRVN
ncbi:hypothetical protein M3Y94_01022800 [Aphelenchoides besseyi]|nr:hypothetical protein M3Y94_01022800 [Aphelenchoides besseyi]KAI6216339.1 Peptidase A1 domain-containing protein [Aphelenchoides besseyi]